MPHTQVVHNVRLLFPLFALVTVLGALMESQESTPLLDLTKPVPRELQETGLPGMSVGGTGGQQPQGGYVLPLEIELTSIEPQPIKLSGKLTVEVRLRNTSAADFLLAASQNSAGVLQHEGRGRRNFTFDLIFEDPKSGRRISSVAAIAAGAETINGSLLRIAPGKEIRVVFTADCRVVAAELGREPDKILVRAGGAETMFEDRRYFIEKRSREIASENTQTVVVEH